MFFILYSICKRVWLLPAICNKRLLLFYITRVRCICVNNNFGQYIVAPVKPATKFMVYTAYIGLVHARTQLQY